MAQMDINDYATAIQYQLSGIITPTKVYANFNRNFATENKFVTWQLRNVHQPVYTGQYQNVKGIDTPIFQISVYSTSSSDGYDLTNTIIQALHGYSGIFGDSTTTGFQISKADVVMLYQGYDDEIKLYSVYMDCTLYIPT